MKILFISPSREIKGKEIVTDELERMYGIEPLGFEMLGAMVLANHDVEIIDLTYESHLREALQVFKPDIVGVTCQAMRMVYSAQDVCKKVKAYNPEILTIVGGMPVTFYPEEFNKKYIDVLVIGEGEITFKELVAAIEKKKEYKNIKGIGYRENGKLLFTSPRPLISDLNTLPLPARNLAEKYFDKYINAAIQVPIQIMYTSRGCPHNCIFCSVARFYGKKIRYQSPGRGID